MLSLSHHRNTPQGNMGPPSQRLMGRRTRTLLLTSEKLSQPALVKGVKHNLKSLREKTYYEVEQAPYIAVGPSQQLAPTCLRSQSTSPDFLGFGGDLQKRDNPNVDTSAPSTTKKTRIGSNRVVKGKQSSEYFQHKMRSTVYVEKVGLNYLAHANLGIALIVCHILLQRKTKHLTTEEAMISPQDQKWKEFMSHLSRTMTHFNEAVGNDEMAAAQLVSVVVLHSRHYEAKDNAPAMGPIHGKLNLGVAASCLRPELPQVEPQANTPVSSTTSTPVHSSIRTYSRPPSHLLQSDRIHSASIATSLLHRHHPIVPCPLVLFGLSVAALLHVNVVFLRHLDHLFTLPMAHTLPTSLWQPSGSSDLHTDFSTTPLDHHSGHMHHAQLEDSLHALAPGSATALELRRRLLQLSATYLPAAAPVESPASSPNISTSAPSLTSASTISPPIDPSTTAGSSPYPITPFVHSGLCLILCTHYFVSYNLLSLWVITGLTHIVALPWHPVGAIDVDPYPDVPPPLPHLSNQPSVSNMPPLLKPPLLPLLPLFPPLLPLLLLPHFSPMSILLASPINLLPLLPLSLHPFHAARNPQQCLTGSLTVYSSHDCTSFYTDNPTDNAFLFQQLRDLGYRPFPTHHPDERVNRRVLKRVPLSTAIDTLTNELLAINFPLGSITKLRVFPTSSTQPFLIYSLPWGGGTLLFPPQSWLLGRFCGTLSWLWAGPSVLSLTATEPLLNSLPPRHLLLQVCWAPLEPDLYSTPGRPQMHQL
ncbi:hypothetical protein PR048_023524 [Dryococelus australis]|uniref:Uncharacterized protein n=1 Tax=Dryococelus australis TaxID=614101 RepID=A0ABQ9GUE7_9NEOP|nr:hypothetical protein PR048_023524 [Dryococelus australis]